jgi:hypothetical protein
MPLSHAAIGQLYNSTNPVSLVLTATRNPALPSLTRSPTFTSTPTLTALPPAFKTKTALVPTATAAIIYITTTNTPSRTWTASITNTPSRTLTNTRTRTRTATATITQTPTASKSTTITPTPTITLTATTTNTATATPNNGITYTPSNTRTPFMLTRTMLARRSPTFFAQTRTATWMAVSSSQTAIPTATYRARLTQTAAVIQTLTAYPVPASPTRSSTPYPSPKR